MESVAKGCLRVVMQPGIVDTQLSSPFQGNVADEKLFSPAYSAQCLLEVLDRMTAAQSGCLVIKQLYLSKFEQRVSST